MSSQTPSGRMKIVVDSGLCEANAVCVKLAPNVFQLDDQDELSVTGDDETLQSEAVTKAVKYCPKGALSIAPT